MTFDFPIAAAWAYQNREKVYNRSGRSLAEIEGLLSKGNAKEISQIVFNDLAIACQEKFPILKMACDDLKEVGALASEVSGSGPTCFGLFESVDAAENAKGLLKGSYPEEALKICVTASSNI